MSIAEGESGKEIVVAASLDMSASTNLELKFNGPNGESFSRSSPDVTAPAVPLITSLGTLDASTYFQYTVLATDFPIGESEGEWTVCGIYTNDTLTPDDIFSSQDSTFTILPGCA